MIADKRYKYDDAGNPIAIESMSNEFDNRYMLWDSENRLRRLDTQSESHIYTYNHAGERTLKRFACAENLSINAAERGSLMNLSSEFTAYISQYFVATDNSYTKHYFSDGTRIASKIGTAVYNDTPSVDSSIANMISNPIDMQAGSTYSSSGEEEKDLYFFYTDHLGSTTYLTGREEVEQYISYTPYGEPFVETRSVSPYKFNGKELDTETGLYYYGARYYNPSSAQYEMYEIINEFYQSNGEEFDSTTNAIALYYLKRSAEQGYYSAELELSRLKMITMTLENFVTRSLI